MLPLASSYRDADGFVFAHSGKIYRFIRPSYFTDYKLLMESGLYKDLTEAGRLVRHEEQLPAEFPAHSFGEGKIILPEQIDFISYPYEWTTSMWRDAAIVTLKIALASLEKGMMLKDATPFNIQFFKGRPVFIDTLSFEKYEEGKPWIAYRQFCECFLGPLLLMHYGHRDMGKLYLSYPNGIPPDITKSLLPLKAKWNLQVYLHIWLQAKVSANAKNNEVVQSEFSKQKLLILLKGLTDLVSGLKAKKSSSEWDDYYIGTILGQHYLQAKATLVKQFTEELHFKKVVDLGANDGFFSIMLKDKAALIVATDADSNCIDALYRQIRNDKIKNIIPLVSVLNTPSPAIGWNNAERYSLTERLKADLVLALALVHHLAITVNLPLEDIAKWLANMGEYLIIEFVPKADEKVQQLLKNREDIFSAYSLENFQKIFTVHFNILKKEKVGDTERVLFLMSKK